MSAAPDPAPEKREPYKGLPFAVWDPETGECLYRRANLDGTLSAIPKAELDPYTQFVVRAARRQFLRSAKGKDYDLLREWVPDVDKLEEFPFLLADQFKNASGKEVWLVDQVLELGATSCWYGPSGAGKTFNVVDLAACVARGVSWRGHDTMQGSVLYLALESAAGVRKRFVGHANYHGYSMDDLPVAVVANGMDLASSPADAGRVAFTARMLSADVELPCRLIIVDTLARSMGGDSDEQSNKYMTALANNAEQVQRITGAHVLFIHHPGKNVALGARGGSALPAAVSQEFLIDAGCITQTKAKETEKFAPMYFSLEPAKTGMVDDKGRPQDTAVAVEVPEPHTEPPEKHPEPGSVVEDALALVEAAGPDGIARAECAERIRAKHYADKPTGSDNARKRVDALLANYGHLVEMTSTGHIKRREAVEFKAVTSQPT